MADEQHRWLDRETTERLLRGEPLDNVDAAVRDRAERLAQALNALSAEHDARSSRAADPQDELAGEAAALAAFRKARAERADVPAAAAGPRAADGPADDGAVRIGTRPRPGGRARVPHGGAGRSRPGWGRPVRLVLSAALAAGAVGGVAAAATTGVLPAPFGGDDPEPAASVPDRATPVGPSLTHSSAGTPGGEQSARTPGGAPAASSGGAARDTARGDDARGGGDATPGPEDAPGDGSAGRWGRPTAACRDLRAGKDLDTVSKRALEGAAGGPARVWAYCDGILKAIEGRGSGRGGQGPGAEEGGGQGGQNGQGNGHGGDGDGNAGQGGDDEGGHPGGGRSSVNVVVPPPLGPLVLKRVATPPAPVADPTSDPGPAVAASPAAGPP
ncbi:extensin [Streptomyces sp. NPDC015220]|uniref:extensin n=1 Tax=Streptomyces sp. NPDC015220 TaxID=3364947 RepID=UPI0036FABDDC